MSGLVVILILIVVLVAASRICGLSQAGPPGSTLWRALISQQRGFVENIDDADQPDLRRPDGVGGTESRAVTSDETSARSR
jgi:hypothetical protein